MLRAFRKARIKLPVLASRAPHTGRRSKVQQVVRQTGKPHQALRIVQVPGQRCDPLRSQFIVPFARMSQCV
jgi:hypothetical protein